MTREEAIYRLKNMAWLDGSAEREQTIKAIDMAIEALHQKGAYEQTKWERDMALQTLEEHGIGLGQKAEYIIPSGDVMFTSDVVRCKDCRHRYEEGDCTHYYWCRLHDRPVDDTDFCAWGEESEVEG